jgi:hypothetical protein
MGIHVKTFGAIVCELLDDWDSQIRENERDFEMPGHPNAGPKLAVLAAERLTLQLIRSELKHYLNTMAVIVRAS